MSCHEILASVTDSHFDYDLRRARIHAQRALYNSANEKQKNRCKLLTWQRDEQAAKLVNGYPHGTSHWKRRNVSVRSRSYLGCVAISMVGRFVRTWRAFRSKQSVRQINGRHSRNDSRLHVASITQSTENVTLNKESDVRSPRDLFKPVRRRIHVLEQKKRIQRINCFTVHGAMRFSA